MIPKIIHQTWKNADISHWVFKESQASITRHLSDFEYIFWTDEDLEALVNNHYPGYRSLYSGLNKSIKRVDIARCLVLHKMGGIYADLDFIFTKPISEILDDKIDLFSYRSTQAIVKKWDFIGNALMGSKAQHPFWLDFTSYALSLPSSTPVLEHTGPLSLGRFHKEQQPETEITIFGPDIFDNQKCGDGTGLKQYGHHIRTATWQFEQKLDDVSN